MKRFIEFAAVAVCLVFLSISCQVAVDIDVVPEREPDIHTISMAFPTITGANGTKVSLATNGKTQWEVGDKVVIYGNPSSSDDTKRVIHEIIAADIENPEVAVFDVDFSDLDAQYNSAADQTYYPYTVAYPYTEGEQFYYSTGNNNYGRSRFENTNQLLMAGHVSDDKSSIVLNHLTAAITFSVEGDFDSYTFSGKEGTEVVGYSTLVVEGNRRSLGEGRYRQKYKDGGTTGALNSIQGSVNGNGTAVNYIFLPVNAQSGESYDLDSQRYANVVYLPTGFTIKLYKSGDLKAYISSSAPLVIEPGHMINLGSLSETGKLHDYVAPTVHSNTIGVDVSTAYDLSSSATANCYLLDSNTELAENKAYKFKAAKGKGGDVLTNINTSDDDNDVVILWATKNTTTAPSVGEIIASVDFDKQAEGDAYIVFKMPAEITPGNAVIAAKNTAGDILWSWHIWVPASDVTSNQYGLGGQTWMDRNLGALTVAEASTESVVASSSLGLFYAWGRKDPFPGPASLNNSTPIATTGSFNYAGGVMANAANSYASPMTFVATGSDSNQYWATDNDSSLWGTSKTSNDPCPPGYVVPQFKEGEGVWKGSGATGFAYDNTHKWVKMGSGSYIVFPIVGFLDGCQSTAYIREYGARTLIWSSTWKNVKTAYPLRLNSDGSSSVAEERQARGFSVRCVAE